MSAETEEQQAPNLSEGFCANFFVTHEQFRSQDPLMQRLDRLDTRPGVLRTARVDIEAPLGCPFSLFLVRGYPKDAECPALSASLCIFRELAYILAEGLDDATILEIPIVPPEYPDDEDADDP